MYGKIVDYKGYRIWIWCLPSTSDIELKEKAKNKLEKYLNGEIQNLK